MATLISDLAVLLIALAVVAVALHGWGCIGLKIAGVDGCGRFTTATMWLGFGLLLGTIEIVHLFVAIDWRISVLFASIGFGAQLSGVTKDRSERLAGALRVLSQHRWVVLFVTTIVFLWCLRAMGEPTMYDSGLYHFASIRWLNEQPLVLGIGNLHWRLALNQSYFGFLALLNLAPYWGKGYAVGGLFLLILTAATLLEVILTQGKLFFQVVGGILLLYLCLLSGAIANPLPDTAVALVEVVIFLYSIWLFSTKDLDPKHRQHLQVVILVLCFCGVTIKLSSAVFGLSSALLVIGQQWLSDKRGVRLLRRMMMILAVGAAVHFGRGYLLSGAPVFPSPLGGIWSLPWAVAPGVAHFESELIYAWARQPGVTSPVQLAANFGWFAPWLSTISSTIIAMFIAATVLFGVTTYQLLNSTQKEKYTPLYALFFPIFSAFFFWFFTAPDLRFLGAINILYLALGCWLSMATNISLARMSFERAGKLTTCFAWAAGLLILVLISRWLLTDLRFVSGWSESPRVETSVQTSYSGLEVFVPKIGAQCWASSLPCVVSLHPDLQEQKILIPGWFPEGINRHMYKLNKN